LSKGIVHIKSWLCAGEEREGERERMRERWVEEGMQPFNNGWFDSLMG
jgi:hypothetical protein